MRDVIFRGKRTDHRNEWVYGGYCSKTEVARIFGEAYEENPVEILHYIVIDTMTNHGLIPYEVIPETVGQYTGLKDKNGTKIFEWDIIKYGKCARGIVKFGEYLFDSYGWYIEWTDRMVTEKDLYFWTKHRVIEVAGNFYDNPELLKNE